MAQISLFKVGLVAMLFFILASNVLNYVSIASSVWSESGFSSLWYSCGSARPKCFKDNPAGLIATGTALNCLSFVLIIIAQVALCWPRFKDSFALYFVIGSEITTLLSLLFNSTGWYFVINTEYQQLLINVNVNNQNVQLYSGILYGWGFWLMTPSFATSVLAACIGSAILGCTCVTNKYEREKLIKKQTYTQDIHAIRSNIYIPQEPNDPQVLRL